MQIWKKNKNIVDLGWNLIHFQFGTQTKPLLGLLHQVYTRSVIEPLPPPDGDAATKAAERQKKKGGKMTDEEIMEKLSAETTHHKQYRSYSWLFDP